MGSYEAISSGFSGHGIEVLTGSPYTRLVHAEFDGGIDALWNKIEATYAEGGMVTAASYAPEGATD